MTSSTFSSADFLSPEEAEEGRFLMDLKGVLREEIGARAAAGLSQARLAELAGMDPAQLSRALSPDAHVSTRTLFRLALALERRWQVALVPLAAVRAAGSNQPAEGAPASSRANPLLQSFAPSFAGSAAPLDKRASSGAPQAPSRWMTAS